MAFKDVKMIEYKRKGSIVEITIRDQNGMKLWDFKATNNKDYAHGLDLIEKKFGYKPIIDIKDSINEEKKFISKDWEW